MDFSDSFQRMFGIIFITSAPVREEYFTRIYLQYQGPLSRVLLNPNNNILLKQSFMNRYHSFDLHQNNIFRGFRVNKSLGFEMEADL